MEQPPPEPAGAPAASAPAASAPAKGKKKKPQWKNSKAKKILRQDIIDGKCDGLKPKQVYQMHPDYAIFPKENFSNNLRNLRLLIKKQKERSDFHLDALMNDLTLNPRPAVDVRGVPRWHESEAERKLKIAVAQGLHRDLKPKELHASDPDYLVFPLAVFRDHVYQEIRSQTETEYWKNFWKSRGPK